MSRKQKHRSDPRRYHQNILSKEDSTIYFTKISDTSYARLAFHLSIDDLTVNLMKGKIRRALMTFFWSEFPAIFHGRVSHYRYLSLAAVSFSFSALECCCCCCCSSCAGPPYFDIIITTQQISGLRISGSCIRQDMHCTESHKAALRGSRCGPGCI